MGNLDKELKRYFKSEEFDKKVIEAIKKNPSKAKGIKSEKEAVDVANRLKERILTELMLLSASSASAQKSSERYEDPHIGDNTIKISNPIIITENDKVYFEIMLNLEGEGARKKSISPNQSGLRSILLLYDTGYSEPIKGRLPYTKTSSGIKKAKKFWAGSGYINTAITAFNSSEKHAKAIRK